MNLYCNAHAFFFRHETVNIHTHDKPEWFAQKVNPLGKVPVIQLDDKIVFDSKIVNGYLDATYPGPKVVPSDPFLAAQGQMILELWERVSYPH